MVGAWCIGGGRLYLEVVIGAECRYIVGICGGEGKVYVEVEVGCR